MAIDYATAHELTVAPAREQARRPHLAGVARSNHYLELPAPPVSAANETESSGLAYHWLILSRHKALWIVFGFAGLLLGFLITLPQTPVYQARGSVEIVDLNQNFLNLKQASPLAENSTTSDWDIQTEIKILQSESLRDRVIAKLEKDPEAEGGAEGVSLWRKALNLSQAAGVSRRQQQVLRAAKTLKVRAAGQTRILEIIVESTNPRLAAAFVNTLANEFIEQNLEARWQISEKTGDWLSRQLDEMKIKLERSEDALQGYARNSGLIFTDEKTNISEDKLRQLQQELSSAEAERMAKQSRFELAQSSAPESLPEILNDGGLRETYSKLTDLRQQLAELKTTYTPEHVKVKRVEAQVAELEQRFAENRDNILKRIRNEYQEAARREQLLSAAYEAQTRVVSGQGEKAIQYNILKREVDTNRQLYEAMLQELKESSIAAAMHASNIRVLDAAKAPPKPYRPDARRSAVLGLLAGVLLGGAFILVRDRMDRTIQQPGDIALYLNVPELGLIPSGGKKPGPALGAQTGARPALAGAGRGERREPFELTTFFEKQSIIADSFRSILVSIFFSGESGFRPKTLVLTSASPGEGKSTVTSNLAVAIAETGQRVLLVDADLRKPRQHDIFGMDNRRGLSTLLRRGGELAGRDPGGRDDLLAALIRKTEVPSLFLLTSGPPTGAATNLLCDPFASELIMGVRSDFDVVLIDTPPMLHMPDARILARLADALVLVIRAGHTSRDAALAAHRRFVQDGTRVLGTILNDWDPKYSPSGYYGYEAYYRADSEQESPAIA